MTELRRDPIIGRWVIINTDDPRGPDDFEKEDNTPRHKETCVFCPRKESRTPPEVESFRLDKSAPDTPGWSVRIVPNKFPALKLEGSIDQKETGIFNMMDGVGAHEVLIETPDHDRDLADLSDAEMLYVVRGYKHRAIALSKDKRFQYILIFKNYGKSAGTSQEHAHSQIIALPMVPKYVLEEIEGAENYYRTHRGCVFCDMMSQEFQDKERIVAENEDFVAFCPFTPRYAFETWILPKRHSAHLTQILVREEIHLAHMLREILYRMKVVLSSPSYNFYLHIAPIKCDNEKSFHWHIEVIPKLTRVAGFEWGTGFYVVPTEPASAAKYLRRA